MRWSSRRFAVPITCLAAFAGGALVSEVARGDKRDDSPHAAIEQLAKVLVQVENRYVDPVDRAKLIEGAIKGMVAELDPHSEYFPPTEFADFTGETEGKFGGVGIEFDASGEYLTVLNPIEGGPAEAAGIKQGDQVIAVDGKDAKGIAIEKSVRLIRGAPGTKIELTIRRPNEGGKLYKVPLVRKEIHVPSVDWDVLPGGVAYLRIRAFQERTHADLVDAIGKAKAKIAGKILGVVLDMRRNPGGLVDQAVDVADEFMDKGIIFSTRGQGGKTLEETKASSGGLLVSVPTVVLVDEGSASAAELVAGALQDSKRAPIIGMQTYGKGSVQTIIELPGGAGLKLTTARYYTPSGRSIQAQGIVPDVKIEPTRLVVAIGLPFPKEKDFANALSAEGEIKGGAGVSIPVLPAASSSSSANGSSSATSTSTSTTTTVTTTSTANGANGEAGATMAPTFFFPGRKPDLEKDFQLRMAHQIVTGVLAKK